MSQYKYPLTLDIVFKAVFGRDTKNSKIILMDLLNTILGGSVGKTITSIELKNPFLIEGTIEQKKPVLDIKASTNTGEQINIEIQVKNLQSFVKRMVYYLTRFHSEQLEEGQDYRQINKTIQIQIVNFQLVEQQQQHTMYLLKEKDSHRVLTDDLEIHCLQLPFVDDTITIDNMDYMTQWMTIIKDLGNPEFESVIEEIRTKKEVINMAINEYRKVTSDSQIKEQLASYEKAEHDRITYLNEAREEGIEQGLEQGLEKGKQAKGIEIAKTLIGLGHSVDEVVKITGLTKEEFQ